MVAHCARAAVDAAASRVAPSALGVVIGVGFGGLSICATPVQQQPAKERGRWRRRRSLSVVRRPRRGQLSPREDEEMVPVDHILGPHDRLSRLRLDPIDRAELQPLLHAVEQVLPGGRWAEHEACLAIAAGVAEMQDAAAVLGRHADAGPRRRRKHKERHEGADRTQHGEQGDQLAQPPRAGVAPPHLLRLARGCLLAWCELGCARRRKLESDAPPVPPTHLRLRAGEGPAPLVELPPLRLGLRDR